MMSNIRGSHLIAAGRYSIKIQQNRAKSGQFWSDGRLRLTVDVT